MKKIAMLSVLFTLNFNSECMMEDTPAIAPPVDGRRPVFSICGGVVARARRTTNIDSARQASDYWFSELEHLRESFGALDIAEAPLEERIREVSDYLGRLERAYEPPEGADLESVDLSPESFFAANLDVIARVSKIVEILSEDPASDPLWLSIERESNEEAARDENELALERMNELLMGVAMTEYDGPKIFIWIGYRFDLQQFQITDISLEIEQFVWPTICAAVERNPENRRCSVVRQAKKSVRQLVASILRHYCARRSPRPSITARLEITGRPLDWLTFDPDEMFINVHFSCLVSPRARARRANTQRSILGGSLSAAN